MGARKISGLKDRLHFSMKYLGIILLLSGALLNGYSQINDVQNIKLGLLIEDLKRNKADQALWELVGPTTADFHNMGLVDEVLFNPEQEEDYLLSPNHGGIWKNRQTGNSWENISDDLFLPGIAATEMIRNPFDNNHIIASTGSGEYGTNYGYGLIESFDNGESWQVMTGFSNNLYTQVNRVIYDPYDSIQANGLTLYAITKTKIYKSENTGLSWSEIENGPIELYEILHNEYIDIEIDNQGNIYLTSIHIYGFNGQVFKSQNGQWQNLNPGYSNFDSLQRARITKPVEGTIFLLADTQHDGRRIFKSYDYGNTWEYMRNTPNNGFKNEIEYSPESNIVYVGGINIRVFYDEAPYPLDTIFPLHVDIRDFEIMGIDSAGYEHVLTATDGGALLIKTNIHNISDYQQEDLNGNHLPIGNFIGMSVTHNNEEKIIGGTVHCRSFIYENNAWDDFGGGKRGGDAGDCELNWQNPSLMYYQNNEFLVRKMDTIEDTIYDVEDWFIGMKYELNPNDPGIVYCGRKGKLLIYHDEMDSLEIKMIPQETGSAGALGINNRNEIYMAAFQGLKYNLENRFLKSSDNGNTWSDLSKNPIIDFYNDTTELRLALNYKMIMDILFNPENPEELWISGGGISIDWSDKSSKLNYPGKYRVMHSMDGGENWEDYSEGLTALPVAALEYQLGSNNRIFAGTEAGVFYREPGMQQWEPFTEGLPVGLISDLDYEPCSGYLYACIDSRGIWKTPLNFETENIEITGETNWDYTKRLTSDIIIGEGAKLNISGDIFMPEGKKIVVEPGGKLVLDGGKISNTCGGMWHGIEVLGNPAYGPDLLIQGFVELKNKATLENAKFGIYAHKLVFENEEWKYQPGFEGGMIQAENSKFVNNKNALCLINSKDENSNYLHNCHFETNNNYIGEQNPESFISLEDVQGLEIFNCTFVNKSENDQLHTGISALNSRFYVYGNNISSAEPGKFENLDYGIYAIDYDQTRLPDIRNNLFINNFRGIYLKGYTESIIKANHFYLNQKAETKSYGVYLDESFDFFVEENLFVGDSTSNQTGIGIIVNHSGNKTNEIKLNQFANLEYGINVQGINRSQVFPNKGLMLKCNEYEGCLFSQTILPENIHDIKPGEGIAMSQGFVHENIIDFPGNKFNGSENLQYDFYNESSPVDYFIPEAYEVSYTPNAVTNHTINNHYENTRNLWGMEDDCIPTKFIQSNEELQDVMENYEFAAEMASQLFYNYSTNLDDGNIIELRNAVQNSNKTNVAKNFTKLFQIAPWLSHYVIEDIINNSAFTSSMVSEIMLANPDASKNLQLIQALYEKRADMPGYMMAHILESRHQKSAKQMLEAEMAWWENKSNKAYNLLQIYYTYHSDSLNFNNKDFNIPGLFMIDYLTSEKEEVIAEDMNSKIYIEPVLFPNLQHTLEEMAYYYEVLLMESNEQIKVFPNPANDHITIDYHLAEDESGILEITNSLGQKIVSLETRSTGLSVVITENWVSGIYFLNLISINKTVQSVKFILAK